MPTYSFDERGQGSRYIRLEGLENRALNYHVIRGFAHISTLEKISNSDKYQREIDEDHALDIKKYLKGGVNRFLPEIILSLNLNKVPEEYKSKIELKRKKTLMNSGSHPDNNTTVTEIRIHVDDEGDVPSDLKNAIMRVDGNHRLRFASDYISEVSDDYIVSFCLIDLQEDIGTSNEEFIFYLINNKAKPLMDEENLKFIIDNPVAFSDAFLKKEDFPLLLTRYIAKENTAIFDSIYKNFGDKKLSNIYSVANVTNNLTSLSIYEKDEDIRTNILKIFFKVNALYENLCTHDKVHHLEYIVQLITYVYLDFCNKNKDKETQKWLEMFIDWLELNNLFGLKSVSYQEIWNIFHQIHQSKSNKVFVSLAVKKETDDVYKSIRSVINEINSHFDLNLEPIRIDQYRKGVTYGISDEILKHIREGGLLIGDLTYENANVYHEVGYMMGLCHERGTEEQIILLFNKEANKDISVKFNLAGKRHLRFSTCTELERDLYKELEAYVRKYKIGKYIAN
ncbi:hypothetical protein DU40_13550 [Methanosarcina mazei]|uniref:DGQHR domain-containing protein n=1 Tax=Methanosarcina mazei TaxID=2209 RepID=A0A0F8DT71_METMZ|nr:hypothetical protein [Methanosarcina mazei]KKG05868.1 hypothetical protein DU40_13550 [Methanosarcina mazei]